MINTTLWCMLSILPGLVHAFPGEAVLSRFPANALSEINASPSAPENALVEIDSRISVDQGGSFKITFQGNGPADVMLFRVPISNLSDAVLWYRAHVRTEDPSLNAYLEMFCTFADGHSYFSRAMNAPVGKLSENSSATGRWAVSQTPFLLDQKNAAVQADLGVRFEQPGTVWLDEAELVWVPRQWNKIGAWLGVFGGALGALAGLWGAAAGILVPKGRGRRGIMVAGGCFLCVGLALLGAGVLCWLQGVNYAIWYPLTLAGGILTVLMGFLLPSVARQYRAVELRRIAELDQADTL